MLVATMNGLDMLIEMIFYWKWKLEQIKKIENDNGNKIQDGRKDLYNLYNTKTKDCLCGWNGMVLERTPAVMSIN